MKTNKAGKAQRVLEWVSNFNRAKATPRSWYLRKICRNPGSEILGISGRVFQEEGTAGTKAWRQDLSQGARLFHMSLPMVLPTTWYYWGYFIAILKTRKHSLHGGGATLPRSKRQR